MKQIKLVVVSDSNVGKTELLISYTTNEFPGEYIPTVFDNYSANVMVEDQAINLQLWDMSGKEDYQKLHPLSYPQTDVFLVLFSVVYLTSLKDLDNIWVPEIKLHCLGVPYILVGTSTHLRDEFYSHETEYRSRGLSPIPYEKGLEMKQMIGAYDYIECDSKKQYHLKEVFETAIKSVIHNSVYETRKDRKRRLKREKKEEKKKNKKKFHFNFHFS